MEEPAELESFLETVPGMIYRTHYVPPYDIAFVSEEMTAVAGFPAADFIGPNPKRRWVELIHPEDREKAAAKMRAAPADGTVIEVEYRVRRADGSWAWIYSRARKVVGPGGDPWLHGAAIDATARREAEDLRRRLEAEEARSAAIEASRTRIVEAADEARRRIERDLHDGAQQRLVVACLTLRRAAALAPANGAEPLLLEALEHVQQGLEDLRELAHGIHPTVLTEHGLVAALEGLAARASVPVELTVEADALPPPVESALYFTVAEALTNVAKHAQAASAVVDVRRQEGTVQAEVRDDGAGGASAAGSGLRGLADRLEALGGSLEVESPPGRGTVVRARLPLE